MDMQLPAISGRQELVDAFHLFTHASKSLEGIHGQLLKQIEHLSQELEASNIRLSESLQEMATMRNKLLHIIECQPNGILVLDLSGNILHSNQQAHELLALPQVTSSISIQNPKIDSELCQFVSACLEQPEKNHHRFFALPAANNHGTRYLSISVSPLPARDVASAGMIFVVNDNTDFLRLEEENRRRERLSAMGAMAAQLAHEIRNPLNSIGLFASLIEEQESADTHSRKWCAQIDEAVQVLNVLVCNMLNLAAPANKALAPIELHQSLNGVLEFSHALIDSHNVRLQTTWQADQSYILGDQELVRQLVLNLVLNALQAMPSGGELHLQTANSKQQDLGFCIELTVADTGIGIDADTLPRIFESGFSTRSAGHGLGLWIVGQTVERLKGRIQVTSQPGKGTAFRLLIPAIKDSECIARQEATGYSCSVEKS